MIDYGCGIGADTLDLLHQGFAVVPCDYTSPSTRFLQWRASREDRTVQTVEPDQLDAPPDADALWIIDTLDHLPNPDSALETVLATVHVTITEDVRANRSHGKQRFHHRMSTEEVIEFFAHHNFAPEPPTAVASHLTIWHRCEG